MSTVEQDPRQRIRLALARTPGLQPLDVATFLSADCLVLASALHDRTGYKVRAFTGGEAEGLHAFVVCPVVRYVDVEGWTTPDEYARRWGYRNHRELTDEEVAERLALPDLPEAARARRQGYLYSRPESKRRARQVADLLVRKSMYSYDPGPEAALSEC